MPNLQITPFLVKTPQHSLGRDSGRWAIGWRKDRPALVEDQSPTTPIPTTRRIKKSTIIVITAILGLLAGVVVGTVVGVTLKKGRTTTSPSTTSAPASSTSLQTPPVSSTSPASPAPSGSSPQPIPTTLAAAFASSSWIWLGIQALTEVPPGDWAFRISLPTSTAPAAMAIILLTVDDHFTLYHNGRLVANSTELQLAWRLAMPFQVSLDPDSNVLAVRTHNIAKYAGLLSSIQISYADGSNTIISSDSTWRVTQPVPDGFELSSFDDSQWAPATVLTRYGSKPWYSQVSFANEHSLIVG
ncbi:hypothetical protein BD779DRAFT_1671153 [Infundibulicybe gibba]|nr:hypothetical protein BD779DRAFT_1671153 [Infundibulicybe gibba]